MSGIYANIDSVGRKITQVPVVIDGVERYTKTGYACIDGVSRQFFSSGIPISTLSVGDSVYMNVNGTRQPFLIVNQGRPSTMYDSSCNGTWLLMQRVYGRRVWDSTSNDYANSDIHAFLNSTFLNLFDSGIQSAIKQVKIPYQKGTGSSGSVASGSSGLSTKIFLLACCEVDDTLTAADWAPADGACLSYFKNATNAKRQVAGYDWTLRSPRTNSDTLVKCVYRYGYTADLPSRYDSWGLRPALILPSTTLVDESFNIIA